MTDEEVVQKFRLHGEGALPRASIDRIVHEVMNLEKMSNIASIMRLSGTTNAVRTSPAPAEFASAK
jgi:hypothetical protein